MAVVPIEVGAGVVLNEERYLGGTLPVLITYSNSSFVRSFGLICRGMSKFPTWLAGCVGSVVSFDALALSRRELRVAFVLMSLKAGVDVCECSSAPVFCLR